MARPLRIEGAGLWYHVMCRGNGGQHVFVDDTDREAFLARLGMVAGAFHVELHAYALMGSHVHLFARTRAANLGRFMQRLLSGYTQWFNKRHDVYGHLFQGRYKALLVDKNAYGKEVSRYIHLNPVRTGMPTRKAVAEQRAALRGYRWSSYRAMIGLARKENWLETKETLARWGDTPREQQRQYAAFVEQGLVGEIADPTEEAQVQSILGRDGFLTRVKRLVYGRKASDLESEQARRRLLAEDVEDVIEEVARAYKIKPEEVRRSGGSPRRNDTRDVAMWLARERCAARCTLGEIGKAMGGVGRSAVNMAYRRVASRARRDKHLKRMMARLS